MEPGTFKDRLLLEGDPHQLIEGVIVAAYAIEADVAYIFLRWEYRLAARAARSRPSPRPTRRATSASNILGSRLQPGAAPARQRRPLHVRRGDRRCSNALEGKRADPARQAALPADLRPVGQADDGQQRRDALQRAAHRQPTAPTGSAA